MRFIHTTALSAVALALLAAGGARAQDAVGDAASNDAAKPAVSDDSSSRDELRDRVTKQFDGDGDGELNDDERGELRAFMLDRFEERRERRGDRDGGGRRGRGFDPPPRGRDGDQWGPPPRWEDGPSRGPDGEGPDGPPPGSGGPEGGPGFGGPGPDGSGPPDGPEGRERVLALFDSHDEDKDGKLSREEFTKLADQMHAMRERMREMGPPGPPPREGRGFGGPRGFGPPPEFGRHGRGDEFGPPPPRRWRDDDRGPRHPRHERAERSEAPAEEQSDADSDSSADDPSA